MRLHGNQRVTAPSVLRNNRKVPDLVPLTILYGRLAELHHPADSLPVRSAESGDRATEDHVGENAKICELILVYNFVCDFSFSRDALVHMKQLIVIRCA